MNHINFTLNFKLYLFKKLIIPIYWWCVNLFRVVCKLLMGRHIRNFVLFWFELAYNKNVLKACLPRQGLKVNIRVCPVRDSYGKTHGKICFYTSAQDGLNKSRNKNKNSNKINWLTILKTDRNIIQLKFLKQSTEDFWKNTILELMSDNSWSNNHYSTLFRAEFIIFQKPPVLPVVIHF